MEISSIMWLQRSILILLASCQQTCMTYTIAVCTVKNSWWWTEELSETYRVSFQNKFEKLVRLVGFIIRNPRWFEHSTSWYTSDFHVPPHRWLVVQNCVCVCVVHSVMFTLLNVILIYNTSHQHIAHCLHLLLGINVTQDRERWKRVVEQARKLNRL
jgi:hypothetical protein